MPEAAASFSEIGRALGTSGQQVELIHNRMRRRLAAQHPDACAV
jgi:hypothetical protein